MEDDARRAVDVQLKAACECLIFDVSHQLSAAVMMLHAQAESSAPPPLDALVIEHALAGVFRFGTICDAAAVGRVFRCLSRTARSNS